MSMFAEHWGWPPPATPYMEVGAFIEGSTIRYADLLLASSHTTARFCSERYGCALDAIDVIHSGIDTTLFQPRPSRAVSSGPNVLFVGKLSAGKGIGTLVAAVLDLIDRYPGIRLRAVGKSGGDFLAELSARVRARGAEERVEFTGNVAYEQLPAHYNWCDLFVAPTVFEPGPGNVYLEAMACGKPVIACSGGGAAEVVLHERTGLLVAPNSVDAVAAAIAALADDAGRREEIGKAGRLWVEQEFSVERYLDKVEAAYQRALGTA
jgi:phosphatidylinositol alpha-1,6-mannosyltransferase